MLKSFILIAKQFELLNNLSNLSLDNPEYLPNLSHKFLGESLIISFPLK